MIPLLEQHREEIQALCRKYGITRLEVFGSAVNGKFDPTKSDVDFLYEIDESPPRLSKRYFGFIREAETLLGRHIDMIYFPQAENPFFRKRVESERTPFYAA